MRRQEVFIIIQADILSILGNFQLLIVCYDHNTAINFLDLVRSLSNSVVHFCHII